MRLLPAKGHRTQAWKNGLGVSSVIVEVPPGAGFEATLWQVSATEISTDCPFSHLPGLDRTFMVIAGAGVELASLDEATGISARQIVEPLRPYAFSGDWRTTCRLLDGPVRVLNVMTRRAQFAATLDIRSTDRETHLERTSGEVRIAVDLHTLDAWLLDGEGIARGAVPPPPGGGHLGVVTIRSA